MLIGWSYVAHVYLGVMISCYTVHREGSASTCGAIHPPEMKSQSLNSPTKSISNDTCKEQY